MFIHDALDELITCGQTAIQAPELREELILLNKVDPMNMMTGFEQQFQVPLLCLTSWGGCVLSCCTYCVSSDL